MTNFAYVAIKLCLACSLQDINVNGTDSLRKREILIGRFRVSSAWAGCSIRLRQVFVSIPT